MWMTLLMDYHQMKLHQYFMIIQVILWKYFEAEVSSYGQGEGKNKHENRKEEKGLEREDRKRVCVHMIQNEIM